jgi:hypothetical protein
MAYRRDNSAESALADLSPDYTDEEISRIWQGNEFAEPYLLPEVLSLDLTGIRKLDCPLIHLCWPLRLQRQLPGRGGMVRKGESAIEAIRVVREFGASADDRGAGKVFDLFSALRPVDR